MMVKYDVTSFFTNLRISEVLEKSLGNFVPAETDFFDILTARHGNGCPHLHLPNITST